MVRRRPAEGGGSVASGPLRRAFTLVEMLVVMGIFAILAALAAASWVSMTRRASREGAAERVMDVLRQARLSAADTGRGAVVRIDPERNLLYGLSTRIEAAWHFDELSSTGEPDEFITPGARSMHGTYHDPPPDDLVEGTLGLCLAFDGSGTFVDCGRYPVYDQTDGIRLEAYVRPQPESGDATKAFGIIAKWDGSKGYRLYLDCEEDTGTGKYSLKGYLTTEETPIQVSSTAPHAQNVTIPGYQWSHVALECDGSEARLVCNGIVVHSKPQYARMEPAGRERLLIGAVGPYDPNGSPPDPPEAYFRGLIDEPRLLSVAGGQRITLPDRVRLVASDERVYFDDQGNLDLSYHNQDVYVSVGDPYQAAFLDSGIDETADTLRVGPRNPFPPTGGAVMVGDVAAAAPMEVMTYDVANGADLNELNRRKYGTQEREHDEGEDIYFARVVRLGRTGLVSKEGDW